MTKSPCTNVCRLNAQQVCVGCGRTLDEIIAWPSASEREQQAIAQAARQRLSIISATPPAPRSDDSSETQ